MSVYPPPTDRGTIFNPIDYGLTTTAITIDYLNANYLKFPVAQGLETMVGINNLDAIVSDDLITANNGIVSDGLITANDSIDITSGTLTFADNTTQSTAFKTLPVSQTYTLSTITTDANGAISSISSGSVPPTPTPSLPVYFGNIPSISVATGLNSSVVVSVNSPTGQLVAGTWLMVAQVKLASANGYGAYKSIPGGQGCFRVLDAGTNIVYESEQAGTSFNNDVACGDNTGTYTYEYNTNITMNCIFTLTATSGFLNFNFTGGIDQNHLQHNVIIDFFGSFQVVKLA
jgi:hypothetical protein